MAPTLKSLSRNLFITDRPLSAQEVNIPKDCFILLSAHSAQPRLLTTAWFRSLALSSQMTEGSHLWLAVGRAELFPRLWRR
jgi:hypothetical protein